MRAKASAQAGFTLLEVLVALAILGLAVVTLMELASQSLRLLKQSGDHQEAVVLADRLLSETQPTDETLDSGQDGNFAWERRVTLMPYPDELNPPGKEPPKLFAVSVAVRWGQKHAIELATLLAPAAPPETPVLVAQPGQQQGIQQGMPQGIQQFAQPGIQQGMPQGTLGAAPSTGNLGMDARGRRGGGGRGR